MSKYWGVDLGGTKIELAILNEDLSVLLRERVPTEANQGYDHILSQINTLIDIGKTQTKLIPNEIGFGTPGSLDRNTRLLKNSNTTCLNGKALHLDLEKSLGVNIKLANDANCFAIAEAKMGAGKSIPEFKNFFGVIMGTGVGGGLVIDNKVINGKHGVGGEWGHNELIENGPSCYCGKSGCVEQVISGPALEHFYESKTNKHKKLRYIIEDARSGDDAVAKETLDRLIQYFGKAIAVIVNIVDPDAIILGGGLSNIDELYKEGLDAAKKHIFTPNPDPIFLKPLLGDSAGVFGAALL